MIADCRLDVDPRPPSRLRLSYNPSVTFRLLVLVLAAVTLVLPLPSTWVERAYSTTIFPRIQPLVTRASNLTAIAWFDVLVVGVSLLFVARGIADLRSRGLLPASVRIVWRLLTVASIVYLLFLAMWGLNYRRQPLREKLAYDAGRVNVDTAVALARETATRLNTLHGQAHAEGFPAPNVIDMQLASSVASALGAVGIQHPVVVGRPKRSVLDLYFRRAGVAGMTDPFFLETLVATDILPVERPHVVAHEWAHLAGITDEGEANFVGWLACLRGSTSARYSGWLFLYSEVMRGLPRDRAKEIADTLAEGPRADLRAIRERYEREVNPRISRAGWQVYDSYLKANRVGAGTASYAEVVQLVLGTGLR